MPGCALVPSRFNVEIAPEGQDFRALYNTATGNYLVLESDLAGLYGRIQEGEVGAEAGGRLLEAGFAVEDHVDEVAAVAQVFNGARQSRYSPHLTVAPTLDCNFGCPYCFESHIKGVMTPAVQERLIAFTEWLADTVGAGAELSVSWFGGEPLMGLPVIRRLSRHFLAMRLDGRIDGYTADIITNGYGLTPKVCEILEACEVSQAQVTLDGPAEIHDTRRFLKRGHGATFDRIVANLHNLPDSVRIAIRMNVDRTNMASAAALFEALEAGGIIGRVAVDLSPVENFSAGPAAPDVLSPREFADFKAKMVALSDARGWPLAATPPGPSMAAVCQVDSLNSFVVSAKGELFKCWAELENGGVAVGHLEDRESWSALPKMPLTERDPFDDPECTSCALLPTCMGSCPKLRDLNRQLGVKACPPFKYDFEALVFRRYGRESNIKSTLRP